MASRNNLYLTAVVLLVNSDTLLASDPVNSTCFGKPLNWTEQKICRSGPTNCDSSMCQSCEDCQIKFPGNLPVIVTTSCGRDNQLGYRMVDCPVRKCAYCLACNTSDLGLLETGDSKGVAVCKGCYIEDTIFLVYGTTFIGSVGACQVNVSCRSLPLRGYQAFYGPVLESTPACPRNIRGEPNIDSVDPERGPVAGGTILTIAGNGLRNIARVVVGDALCDPLPFRRNNTDSRLLCRTSSVRIPGEVAVKGQTAAWPVKWVNSNSTFEFRPNPQVVSILEASTIAAGGIQVRFQGQNLGSSESPVLLVTVICRATLEVVQNFTTECESSDDETILDCPTPIVSDVNDQSCDPSSSPEAADRYNSSYSQFDFIMGLKFDGYSRYTSLPSLPQFGKKGFLQVNNDINIHRFAEEQSVKEFDPAHDSILIIRGDGMNRGAKINDYEVSLGNGTPCVVLTLLSNQITCRPPAESPPIDGDNFIVFKGQKTVSVVVSVGYLDVAVGYLYYAPPILPTILLATLIPGTAVVIAVVATVLCIKRHKKRKSSALSSGEFRGRKSFNLYFSSKDRHGQPQATEAELPQRFREELASYIVSSSELCLKELLGQGQFGKIYRAVLRDKKTVAAKLLKDNSVSIEDVTKFLDEAVLMKDFHHANVLGLCGVVLDITQPIVLVELMEVGDLRTAIKRESFPMGDLINFSTQIANGMVYLSAQKFIHRDLAARNCLLDRSYCVKIGDFGLSHDLDAKDYYRGKDHSKPLPVKWMAPESLANGLFTTASDVWSYGVLMWEIMAKGRTPYADVNNYEIKHYLLSGRRLDCPVGTPDAIYEIMRLCWNAVPSRRPTFLRLLSLIDEFLTSESSRRDLERQFTKSIHQEAYSYVICPSDDQTVHPSLLYNDSSYLEILANSEG